MEVKIDNCNADIKEIPLKLKILKINEEVLFEDDFEKVVVKTFWDSDGRMIPWKSSHGKKQETFHSVKIKIIRVLSKIGEFEFEDDNLYINNEIFPAIDIAGYKGSTFMLEIKAIVGQG